MPKFTKEHRAKLSAAAKDRYAKKGKKRGRKPGVKVGPYKKRGKITFKNATQIVNEALKNVGKSKPMTLDDYSEQILKPSVEQFKFSMKDLPQYTPSQPLTLCGQLEDSILLLENRISNAIAKINSLM